MSKYESPEPLEVVDLLLWREAQQMLGRHRGAGPEGRCRWCEQPWPCPARKLAQRAEIAACRPKGEPWPDGHDPEGVPGWSRGDHPVVAIAAVDLRHVAPVSPAVMPYAPEAPTPVLRD